MKILFFTENYPPESNAAATRVYERACYWQKWGHDVTIITCAPNFPDGEIFDGWENRWRQVKTIDGIRVVRVKTFITPNRGIALRTLDFISYMMTSFFFALFEKRPDVICATSPQFFAAVGGWAVSFVRHIPFVFELGDLWPASIVAVGAMKPNIFLSMIERLELFLYRRSARIAALTQSFKDDLVVRGISGEKISVVINGVDLHRYSPGKKDTELLRKHNLEGKFVLGYIGTHGLAHDLENVVKTAKLAKEAGENNLHFLFVGPGAARERVMKLAKNYHLDNMTFLPRQPKEEMPKYWSLCDLALVHLRNDKVMKTVIPSKIFEAMGMGLPILLVAPEGEATGIINNSGAGIVVPPSNPEVLLAGLKKFVENKTFREEIAKMSHAAAPKYSREKQAKDMIFLFEKVVRQ